MKKESLSSKSEDDLEMLKELFMVLRLTNKYYSKLCKKYNLSEVQFQVLYLLHISGNNSIKMSALGDRLEMARSGVTILVDRMALVGLVKRRPDPDDRRIINITVTEKGKEVMKEIFPSNDVFKVSALDFLQQDEKKILKKLIVKVKERLEKKVCSV